MPTDLQIGHATNEQIQLDFFVPSSGARYDLSLVSKIWFTVKDDLNDADGAAIIAKTLSSGITISSPTTAGIAIVSIGPTDTSALTVAQCDNVFYWDVKIKETSGSKIKRVNYGSFKIVVAATLATS